MLVKKVSVLLASSALALGVAAAPAIAGGGYHDPPSHDGKKKQKCNSGNGNGSDPVTFNEGDHCYGGDPGNSYNAGNRGGDEIPSSGGNPNPGGNNVDN